MGEYDPLLEELEPEQYELYEGEPDFDRPQAGEDGAQDA